MSSTLPLLIYEDLLPTRDYLREITLVLSSLQRGFLPKHPRQWQYGLEVSLRGLTTQPFMVADSEVRAGLDLVRHKVRLADSKWSLHEYAAPEIMNNFKVWLTSHKATVVLQEPEFASGVMLYDTAQAQAYAEALWWMDEQFRSLKQTLGEGVTSPILLYPHHFDLALAWFPFDDERQLSVGFSTGDDTIAEPYVYLTAYPELQGFNDLKLPPEAIWQSTGFTGAVMTYSALRASQQPQSLLYEFMSGLFNEGRSLF